MKVRIALLIVLFVSMFASAQEKNVFDIARSGTVEEMQALCKKQSDTINAIDERQSTPLIIASYKANEPVALFLADKVLDIDYNSGRGTALMAAVMGGNVTIVKKLIASKADLNQADIQGKTALIYATYFNKNEIAKELISAGANKKQKDKDGRTALDYANFNKNTELIILLDNQK